MRILFAAPGSLGHVNPQVPLARAFQRQGHEVLWATSPQLVAYLATLGFRGSAAGIENVDCFARFGVLHPDEASLPPAQRRAVMYRGLFGEVAAPAMLPGLLEAASQFEPDLIVHDANELASPLVAAQRDIPNVAHAFGALVPPQLVESGAQAVAPLWRDAGRALPPFAGLYAHGYIDIYPPLLQPFALDHIDRVIPMRPDTAESEPDSRLRTSLAELPRPVIYVTFGTAFNAPALFGPVLAAARRIDASFVLTVGPSGNPDALGAVPGNVVTERYLPQAAVLDVASLVVSHGGSGTFLATLARGLPQVCVPQAADQFVNAEGCVRIGAGEALIGDRYDSENLCEAISRLLHDHAAQTAARRTAAEIAQMPSPGSVAEHIRQLIDG